MALPDPSRPLLVENALLAALAAADDAGIRVKRDDRGLTGYAVTGYSPRTGQRVTAFYPDILRALVMFPFGIADADR